MTILKELWGIQKFRIIIIWLLFTIPLEILSIYGQNFLGLWERILFAIVWVVFWREIFVKWIKSLFHLKFSDINLLMIIAIGGATYLQELPEAMIIIILFALGEMLEDYGIMKSKQALENLTNNMPKTGFVKDIGEVAINYIKIGDIIIVKPGEQVPIDGRIVFGEALIDETAITWEPLPKSKAINEDVFSWTISINWYLEIKTVKKGKDSTLAKIIDITYNSSQKKTNYQRFIQKFARYYTPSVMILAIALVVVPVFFLWWDFNHWLWQAITLLIISCPCALVLSTPVAIFSAIGNASSRGIVIKWGKYLEEIWQIKAIAMDKTRTLTKWEPKISDIIPLNWTLEDTFLACIGGMEQYSEHPIARCIVQEAKRRWIELHKHNNFISVWGKWIKSECTICKDTHRCLWSVKFVSEEHKIPEKIKQQIYSLEEEGKTIVFVSSHKEVIGIIAITDTIREESEKTVQELKGMWVEVVMLTGDHQKAWESIAHILGISNIKWWLLPDQKAQEIEKLVKQYGSVAMLWDGINDAPALAVSSVGIAMWAIGSDVAIENADIALMNDKIWLIPYLIRLSRSCSNIIKFNTMLAIVVKSGVLWLAIFGISNLSLAIASDVWVTIFVVINGLRLFWSKNKFENLKNIETDYCCEVCH